MTDSSLPVHTWLPEPDLAFHPTRREDRTSHPLVGLTRFGPYSRSLINTVIDPLRVAVITPHGTLATIDSLLKELEQEHQPKERLAYLPKFLGFSRIFSLRVLRASKNVCIELAADVDTAIAKSESPHILLAEKLTQALSSLLTNRSDFDVLLIYLPTRWNKGFIGGFDVFLPLQRYVALKHRIVLQGRRRTLETGRYKSGYSVCGS